MAFNLGKPEQRFVMYLIIPSLPSWKRDATTRFPRGNMASGGKNVFFFLLGLAVMCTSMCVYIEKTDEDKFDWLIVIL